MLEVINPQIVQQGWRLWECWELSILFKTEDD